MTDTLNTGYEAFKGEIWSQKINAGLDKTCVMLQCVNRDYQADADKGTAKINIITPLSVTTGTYTGSIDSYGTAPNKKSQLELNQSVYFGFSVPDIDQAQSNVNIMDAIVGKAKIGQNTAVELTKENIYSNFVKLAKHLKTSGAITAENKGWVVIHPDVEELLLMCSEFTSAANLGDKTLSSGSIGKIAGLDVFVSSNVGKNTDGYTILAGTKQAITYASQIKKIETLRAQSSFDSIVRGLYTFGALAINPDALAVIKATIA